MNEACNVTTALSAFSSISLEEMSTIRLMNRTDTKYIVSLSALMTYCNGQVIVIVCKRCRGSEI